ncbi:type VII secretion protein EccB [Qaidamihabitans albus]|uniref:type VII secretion protein EccB n=1 Tax=Qaidamihabitans albus TaxID=2795733 RepID=UPI0018F1D894|nr:type VII secretion protein EccB [Qaidamihabitans albus]
MPSTPTTKSQVQAYQFVLRRMQSALVRRDAVMLHDPMRTHSRATLVGVVLSAIAMLGFVIFGFFKPAPTPPDSGIVIGEQSGSVYVVTENPKKLVPTFNLASARLILMARQQGEGGAAQGGGAAEVAEASVVPDEQLKDIPRGRLHGIPNGPELLPTEDQRISRDWAVCDETKIDRSLPSSVALEQATTETTVFAGLPDLGQELGQDESILVTAENGKSYLIYRQGGGPNQTANAVRAEVDLSKSSVRNALRLDPDDSRNISMGLLNAIPAVGDLKAPVIDGAGSSPSGYDVESFNVGTVFSTARTDSTTYHVVTRNGVQEVSQAVAEMLRFENTETSADSMPSVAPDELRNLPEVGEGDPDYLDVGHYPQTVPTVLDPARYPVGCLGWTVKGDGANEDSQTAVYVGSLLPGPKDAQNNPQVVDIGSPGPDGWKVDHFYMKPGFAAVVRSATTSDTFGRGNIQLVSDRGMRYGVPDLATAQGLGLGNQDPAPEAILKLLPVGASLNTQDVMRTFDAVPIDPDAGTFENPEEQAAAGGN